ncbi:hypothetical protein QWZ10_06415 [Paracoccus cavernae]|uniref:Uncharacterized protein n=1 Tax=Paracoccus cavernae TaxID=1571207 RepID=A0ABT8D7Z5_9RHOB|nr:hypothetical protein [Paracoccus cavernae]
MQAPLVFRLGYVALNVTDPERAAEDTANIVGRVSRCARAISSC